MPTFVRTPEDEAAWADAKQDAAKQGLTEGHGDNYWRYVNAVFQRRKKTRKGALAFRETMRLQKAQKSSPFKVNSGGYKAEEKEPFEPKGTLDALPPKAVMDGHALVQRPDHAKAVAGRVIAVGKHGIHLRSDDGKVHKVRHEHVLDHREPISRDDPEFPEAAQALHQQGVPMDVEDRFRKPTATAGEQAIPKGAAEMMQMLEDQGVPIDTKRLLSEGSPDEIEEVLSRYVNLDPKPSQLPTTLAKDRIHQAPGWENVFPEGRGRVSRQPSPPKREYADDNDQARDDSFDAIKETGFVGQVNLSPEIAPEDQEHVLRVAEGVFRSLADVLEPPQEPPDLVIQPGHPDDGPDASGEPTEEVGAHYDRRSNRLEIGLGMPESISHAWGHVVDANLGQGKYASLQPDSPIGQFVGKLRNSAGHAELANKLPQDNADEGRRFWTKPEEVFARFFEQWVGDAVATGSGETHHAYVSGVDSPGQLGPEEMTEFGPEFRKLLGSRDRSGALRIRKRTADASKGTSGSSGLQAKKRNFGAGDLKHHLMEEAKGAKGDAGKRLIAGLAHGLKPEQLARAPRHYEPEMAAEHAGIFERAKKRADSGKREQHLQLRDMSVREEEQPGEEVRRPQSDDVR